MVLQAVRWNELLGHGLNGQQIWPTDGWRTIARNYRAVEVNATATVTAGDTLYFMLDQNGTSTNDTTNWDPVITYLP